MTDAVRSLRDWLALALMPDSTAAAEARWRAGNARKRAAGCPCGKPATEVAYDHPVVGRVPHETWTCAEHAGAEQWSGRPSGQVTEWVPLWGRPAPCPSCEGRCSASGPIGRPLTRWYCPNGPGVATDG